MNKSAGAEEKFKEISEAYRVLSDDKLREQYDQFGTTDYDQNFQQANWQDFGIDFEDLFSGMGSFSGLGGFDDLFSAFGGRQARKSSRKPDGQNIRLDLKIAFEESIFGIEKEVTIERMNRCQKCNGSGSEKGSEEKICPKCHGQGIFKQVTRTPFGSLQMQTTCPNCQGEGKVIDKPCDSCRGTGLKLGEETIKVKIPAGINSNDYLRIEGKGSYSSKNSKPGDLFIVIQVHPHKHFKRDGNDLLLEWPITFSQASLGGEITIPYFEEKLKIKIPEGTNHHQIFKLKGKGVKNVQSGERGDLFTKVFVGVPKNLDAKQKRLLIELDEELGNYNFDGEENWFDKLKKKFK